MSHHGGKGYPRTQQIRAERRDRAEQVAQESGYNKLSTAEKLSRVQAFIAVPGNGKAAKQIAKLEKQLAKEKASKQREVVGLDFGGPEVAEMQSKAAARGIEIAICPMPIYADESDAETQHGKRGKKSRKK